MHTFYRIWIYLNNIKASPGDIDNSVLCVLFVLSGLFFVFLFVCFVFLDDVIDFIYSVSFSVVLKRLLKKKTH